MGNIIVLSLVETGILLAVVTQMVLLAELVAFNGILVSRVFRI